MKSAKLERVKPSKYKIIIIGSTPPPHHGSNIYSQNLLNSKIKEEFEVFHLDTSDHRNLDNLSKLDFINVYLAVKNIAELVWILIKIRPELVYIPPAASFLPYFRDGLFILSVGGGNLEKNISPNLVEALKYAKTVGSKITGIVGRDGGFTAEVADVCVIIPTVNANNITPHSEAFQAVVWHLLVSHPALKSNETKWESAVK